MRSHKLAPAVTAVAALLALAPAGAAAAHNHRTGAVPHTGACKLTLKVAPRLVTSGESVLASGIASCDEGQTVTLYQRPAGSPGYSVAGTAVAKEGAYEIQTGTLTKNTTFYATLGALHTGRRNVNVAAVVDLETPKETNALETGSHNAVTFSGSVNPEDAGATIVLQRENALRGTEWFRIGKPTTVNREGKFFVTHAFVVPGPSSIRVVMRPNHRNIASPSNVLSYVISQAQNPLLKIASSQDPLAYGSSTVISGEVPGEPKTALTLLGRTTTGHFAPVATTTSDEHGNYSFPTQTPLTSMLYKVQSGGRVSAVLFEGVKYILSPVTAPASVLSGQPLTVSGSVTPIKPGHAIYLERENAIGGNFHVVDAGTENPDGTYSVSRAFFAPGSYVLRVKIPGDTEDAGSASPTFTVTVTPVPASKIPAESPTNGTPPPTGQD